MADPTNDHENGPTGADYGSVDDYEITGQPVPGYDAGYDDYDPYAHDVAEPQKPKRGDLPIAGKRKPPQVEPRKNRRWPLYMMCGCLVMCFACCCLPFCGLVVAGVTVAEIIDNTRVSESGTLPPIAVDSDVPITLDVENTVGKVEVEAWDRDEVEIFYTKTAFSWTKEQAQKELDDIKINVDEPEANYVRVRLDLDRASDEWWAHANSIDLTICVPREVRLTVDNTVGTIDVSDVVAHTLDLKTETGEIRFDGELGAGSDFQMDTTVGSILVKLPADVYVALDAQTTTGEITVDNSFNISDEQNDRTGPRHTWSGILGTGSEDPPTLRLRATTGGIEVRVR